MHVDIAEGNQVRDTSLVLLHSSNAIRSKGNDSSPGCGVGCLVAREVRSRHQNRLSEGGRSHRRTKSRASENPCYRRESAKFDAKPQGSESMWTTTLLYTYVDIRNALEPRLATASYRSGAPRPRRSATMTKVEGLHKQEVQSSFLPQLRPLRFQLAEYEGEESEGPKRGRSSGRGDLNHRCSRGVGIDNANLPLAEVIRYRGCCI